MDLYLKEIQDRIKSNNKSKYGKAKEYHDGTFWVDKKDPAFILNSGGSLDPTKLYQPRVFLWFPHLLVHEKLRCPKCNIETGIQVKEWNVRPRARRIIDTHE